MELAGHCGQFGPGRTPMNGPPRTTRSALDLTAKSGWPISWPSSPVVLHVFHSLPANGTVGDADHVVVGPGGVFIMHTKHHPGSTIWVDGDTFLVNGTKHPYVRDARHESVRATRALTEQSGFAVPAVAIIAVVGPTKG